MNLRKTRERDGVIEREWKGRERGKGTREERVTLNIVIVTAVVVDIIAILSTIIIIVIIIIAIVRITGQIFISINAVVMECVYISVSFHEFIKY